MVFFSVAIVRINVSLTGNAVTDKSKRRRKESSPYTFLFGFDYFTTTLDVAAPFFTM